MEKYVSVFGLCTLAIGVIILLWFILPVLVSTMLIIGAVCAVLWIAVVVMGSSNAREDK